MFILILCIEFTCSYQPKFFGGFFMYFFVDDSVALSPLQLDKNLSWGLPAETYRTLVLN